MLYVGRYVLFILKKCLQTSLETGTFILVYSYHEHMCVLLNRPGQVLEIGLMKI